MTTHNDPPSVSSVAAPEELHILCIHHRSGTNTSVHLSKALAKQELHAFVTAWWPQEPRLKDLPLPGNQEEAIDTYFERIPRESYDLLTAEVPDVVLHAISACILLDQTRGAGHRPATPEAEAAWEAAATALAGLRPDESPPHASGEDAPAPAP